MSPKEILRRALAKLLPTPGSRKLVAKLVRPVLQFMAGRPGFHKFWYAVQLTVNRPPTVAIGSTWFGARMWCDLTDMVPQWIYYSRVWEPDITRLIKTELGTGDTFVDVGANIGYFSLLAANRVGATGKVYAIEPWPPTVEVLRANVELNALKNVTVVNQAVAAQKSEVSLYDGTDGNRGAVSQSASSQTGRQVSVTADTLANLIGLASLKTARLIKIDVEGAEPPILKELLDLAPGLATRLVIVAEVTPDAFVQYDWPLIDLIRDFASAGFTAKHIANDYNFERSLRFDPSTAPAEANIDVVPSARFDLVLSRH